MGEEILQKQPSGFRLVLSLVRRDYAVQYAGTVLGVVWVIVQNLFQIGIYYLIFGIVLADRRAGLMPMGGQDYLLYLLGGMTLWLPLAEMMVRSGGILSENRVLIRRTSVGADYFVWVPVVQAILHYALLAVPIALIGYGRGGLSPYFPIAWLAGLLLLLLAAGWGFILARISLLLKDVSPLAQLLLQVFFWATPIVYPVTDGTFKFFIWNPFYVLVELHRGLLFEMPGTRLPDIPFWNGLTALVALSIPVYVIGSRRLKWIVADHI